jgi:hypothetical protein
MTNEEKVARLEEIAQHYLRIGDDDAALLREVAQLMRERGEPDWEMVDAEATADGVTIVVERRGE